VNKTGQNRTATVQVGGTTFTVTQLGGTAALKAPTQPRITIGGVSK
jgi:hypothetical protein